jgi:hypothetical protein
MSKELFFEERESENTNVSRIPTTLEMALVVIKNEVLDGNINPLAAHIRFTELEKLLGELKDEIRSGANEEAAKFSKSEYMGYTISLTERQTMDYSHIEKWNKLKNEIKTIEENAKGIYKITGGAEIVNPETGEVQPSAMLKSVSTVLTLKKVK